MDVDFSYLNIGGTFYFLCCVLDGCSRTVVAWDIRATMREMDSAIGYIATLDRLAGRHHEIHAARDKKLEAARLRRKIARINLDLPPTKHQYLTNPAVA